MKLQLLTRSTLGIAIIALASCKNEHPSSPTAGNADFSRYIAVGNSITAGFADGGLYREGQQNSYPEIIAAQMKTIGGGEFASPLFNTGQENGSGYKKVTGANPDGSPVISDVTTELAIRGQINVPPVGDVALFTKYTGQLNNYGVPGISLSQVTLTSYGNLNGFFERLLPGNAPANTTSYLDFITQKPFTFFTNLLGDNDILGFATTGGASPTDQPTDKATFTTLYNLVVNNLTAKGAKGVVALIPDVTKLAFFNTVTLNSLLKAVQASAPSVTSIYIQTGKSETRAATANDLFILPLASANVVGKPNAAGQPYGLDPRNPIENKYVLDKDEVAIVADYTASYNATIRAVAASKKLALLDTFELLNEFSGNGRVINGVTINSTYFTGGLYSLDGVHLTPRGYAVLANAFIQAINTQYGSKIPAADVSKFRTVKLP